MEMWRVLRSSGLQNTTALTPLNLANSFQELDALCARIMVSYAVYPKDWRGIVTKDLLYVILGTFRYVRFTCTLFGESSTKQPYFHGLASLHSRTWHFSHLQAHVRLYRRRHVLCSEHEVCHCDSRRLWLSLKPQCLRCHFVSMVFSLPPLPIILIDAWACHIANYFAAGEPCMLVIHMRLIVRLEKVSLLKMYTKRIVWKGCARG